MMRNEPTAHSPLHRRMTVLLLMLFSVLSVAASESPQQQQAEAPLIAFDEDLRARLDALVTVGRDYAHWDDAWRFATGARRHFPGEGLLAPALSRVGIRHMLVVNHRFQPRLSLLIDQSPLRQSAVPPDAALLEAIRSAVDGGTLDARGQDLRGLAMIDGQPSLLAALPVVRESGNAQPGGWLAFTEPLAGEASQALLRMLGPSARAISREALATETLPPPVRAWLEATPPQPAVLSHREGGELSTWLAVRDLAGQALWVVRVDTTLPALAAATPEPSAPTTPPALLGGAGKTIILVLAALAGVALMMWRARRTPPRPGQPTRTPMPAVAAASHAAAPTPVPGPAAPAPALAPQKPPLAKTLPDAADIVDSAPDGVLLATVSEDRILRANAAALRLFGLSEAELKTQRVLQLLRTPPELGDAPEATLRLDTPTRNLHQVLLDATGTVRDVEVSVVPLQSAGGSTAAIFIREADPRSTEAAATRVSAEQLTVHYQPVVDLETERVCSLEAFPLWKDTAHGWIHPDDPLSIVGEDGAALTISRFVLETAARDLARWRGQNAALVPVSINVAVPVTDRDDVATALRHVVASGIGRELLQFEIMDEALMDRRSGRFRAELLQRWREPGLAITVDHCGARGRLFATDPEGVDAVKLDPGLLRDIATDLPDRAAIEALVQKANARNIPVIAEGVDRWQQIGILRALGCRQAQGPLFSRPLPADETLRFLRGGRLVLMKRDPLEDTDELPVLRLHKPQGRSG